MKSDAPPLPRSSRSSRNLGAHLPFSGLAAAPARSKKRSGARAWQRMVRNRAHVARVQGGCYLAMGMWPLTHMASLEQVTGPKHDAWLMQTAGALLAIIGVVLILGSTRRIMSPIVALLGAGIAGVLAVLAAAFVALGHIPRIYLLDVALEASLVAWWSYASLRRRRRRTPAGQSEASIRGGQKVIFSAYLTAEQRATRH